MATAPPPSPTTTDTPSEPGSVQTKLVDSRPLGATGVNSNAGAISVNGMNRLRFDVKLLSGTWAAGERMEVRGYVVDHLQTDTDHYDVLQTITAKGLQPVINVEAYAVVDVIQLDADNRRLVEETENLRSEVEMLEAENQRLHDKLDSEDFINGALAVLLGVVITLVVPRVWPRRRKSSSWA